MFLRVLPIFLFQYESKRFSKTGFVLIRSVSVRLTLRIQFKWLYLREVDDASDVGDLDAGERLDDAAQVLL